MSSASKKKISTSLDNDRNQELLSLFTTQPNRALPQEIRRELAASWESMMNSDDSKKELLRKGCYKGLIYVLKQYNEGSPRFADLDKRDRYERDSLVVAVRWLRVLLEREATLTPQAHMVAPALLHKNYREVVWALLHKTMDRSMLKVTRSTYYTTVLQDVLRELVKLICALEDRVVKYRMSAPSVYERLLGDRATVLQLGTPDLEDGVTIMYRAIPCCGSRYRHDSPLHALSKLPLICAPPPWRSTFFARGGHGRRLFEQCVGIDALLQLCEWSSPPGLMAFSALEQIAEVAPDMLADHLAILVRWACKGNRRSWCSTLSRAMRVLAVLVREHGAAGLSEVVASGCGDPREVIEDLVHSCMELTRQIVSGGYRALDGRLLEHDAKSMRALVASELEVLQHLAKDSHGAICLKQHAYFPSLERGLRSVVSKYERFAIADRTHALEAALSLLLQLAEWDEKLLVRYDTTPSVDGSFFDRVFYVLLCGGGGKQGTADPQAVLVCALAIRVLAGLMHAAGPLKQQQSVEALVYKPLKHLRLVYGASQVDGADPVLAKAIDEWLTIVAPPPSAPWGTKFTRRWRSHRAKLCQAALSRDLWTVGRKLLDAGANCGQMEPPQGLSSLELHTWLFLKLNPSLFTVCASASASEQTAGSKPTPPSSGGTTNDTSSHDCSCPSSKSAKSGVSRCPCGCGRPYPDPSQGPPSSGHVPIRGFFGPPCPMMFLDVLAHAFCAAEGDDGGGGGGNSGGGSSGAGDSGGGASSRGATESQGSGGGASSGSPSSADARCGACGKGQPEVQLNRCGRCKRVWYCSRVCQKEDWQSHRRTCS